MTERNGRSDRDRYCAAADMKGLTAEKKEGKNFYVHL